ncbi:unnamed protein product [Rangifer tarandus platyrhynchus]|uniref:Uncharacterized protein n=1 Tax=Rangifer tarandus platyrhynchus TaxID=3082113 RepID=A0ACB1KI08_RANTA
MEPEPRSPALLADALPSEPPGKAPKHMMRCSTAVIVRATQIKKHGEVPLHTKPNKQTKKKSGKSELSMNMVQMNLSSKQKWRHSRRREQTYERSGWDTLGGWNGHTDAMDTVGRTDE